MAHVTIASPAGTKPHRQVIRASLRTVCLYGLAGSAYTAAVAVFRPDALGQRVWNASPWPHRDTFGLVAFAASFVACLVLQWTGQGLVRR